MSEQGLGQKLKNRRQELGLTLKDIENKTKIRSYYIDALEQERFSILPDKVYVIGFLKSYAKILKLDSGEIISYFNNALEASTTEKSSTQQKPKEKKPAPNITFNYNKFLRFAIIVIVIVVFVTIQKTWNTKQEYPAPPQFDNDKITQTQNNHHNLHELPKEPPTQMQPVIETIDVEIEPLRGDCWISVLIDNETEHSKLLRAGGDKVSFTGKKEITIKFGSAGAVDVTVNGKKIGEVGRIGEVVTETFKLD